MENHKKTKVCFVSPKSYPLFDSSVDAVFGGAEVDLYMLGTELAKDPGFDVSFVVADYAQAAEREIEGVRLLKSLNFKEGPLAAAIKIWQAMRKANADIYMLKTASPGVPLVAGFCKLHGRAFVYRTAHQRECTGEYIRKHILWGKAFSVSLRSAAIVFAQNGSDSTKLKETVGLNSIVIANGHRIPELKAAGHKSILWVGRTADFKRPELFLELAKQCPDEKFVMICQRATGDDNYEQLCRQARDVKNIEFHDRVPFHEIDTFFQRAKILVNTSSSEGFPNTFIQACKAQAAILSYNVNPDGFLNKFNCGLCADGDREKFDKLLNELLADVRYAELGANGRKYVEEKHDIAKIIDRYKEAFIQLNEKRA